MEKPAVQEMSRKPGTKAVFLTGYPPRPTSTPDRLIVPIYGDSCCGPVPFLPEEALEKAPPELAAKGIDDATWAEWMRKLRDEYQAHALSTTSCIFMCLFGCWPCVCYYNNQLNSGVGKFNADFNREVFEPKGLFWSTQRAELYYPGGDDNVQSYSTYWAAVALTPEEAEKLKEEAHVFYGCLFGGTAIPSSFWDGVWSCMCNCCGPFYT